MVENYITDVDILDEAKENFLTYSEEVLTDRAVPNAEDGLLSVHRKLLWTMGEVLNLNNKSKYKKSASIVGSTLSTSYFHGDTSCYGALCKLAQTYLMRYPLVDGDGNFGSQEANGTEGAQRYTNARPSIYADLMLTDFKKDTVPLKETYNGEYMEPVFLPSPLPNAIVNGREAIAIGLSHNSLPHNLSEVCDGICAYIENKDITTKELMNYIKGPDFPLGNIVVNSKDIETAFETGHSAVSLKVRGDYGVKGNQIIFTSIPYRTYRNKIKEQITKNVDVFDTLIDDFNDESNVGVNKLVFEVKKGVSPEQVVSRLFELTDLQTTLSYNMNFIVNGTPKMCSMLDLVKAYVTHQHNVIRNAATFDKNKAEARIHILKGLIAAVDKIDEVIKLIKASENRQEALNKLIDFLSIDKIQASAILDMKLGKLTKIDKDELVKELHEKEEIVKECSKIIDEESYREEKIVLQLQEIKKKYGDERRTQLLDINIEKKTSKKTKEKPPIIPEDVVVIINDKGEVKKIPQKTFKVQNRGGKGAKTNEIIKHMISTNTLDSLMVFTNLGKLHRYPIDSIPDGTNRTKGASLRILIGDMEVGEEIVAVTAFNDNSGYRYVTFMTRGGLVKKTDLGEYSLRGRRSGLKVITLKDGDSLTSVHFLKEDCDVILATSSGKAIHFMSSDINPTGRVSMGVKGIDLSKDDYVISAEVLNDSYNYLAIVNSTGIGKKISLDLLPVQKRGGKGVCCSKTDISTIVGLKEDDNISICTSTNSIVINEKDIPLLATRDAAGVQLCKNENNDKTKVMRL